MPVYPGALRFADQQEVISLPHSSSHLLWYR
jgi:hypothetical protein